MKMNLSRREIVLAVCGAAVSAPVFGQLGGLGGMLGGGKATPGASIESDVQSFLERSFKIEKTAAKAYLAILAAYAAEADRAKYQSMFDSVGKLTDPKESGAKFQEIRESSEAELKRLSESKDLGDRTKKLSEDKQKQVGRAVGNVLYAGFQAVPLVDNGKIIVGRTKTSPLDVPKVQPVVGALDRLGTAISLSGSVMLKFVDVLKGVNVSVAPASSSSKEAPIDKI